METNAPQGNLMSIEEAAEFLGVSVTTMRRRVASGEIYPMPESLPAGAKKSPKFLFQREDVEKLIIKR